MNEDDSRPSGQGILHPEGMRAARDMAAGLVHEINNLLGVIIGNAHLAKNNSSSPEAVEKYVREVRDAAEEGRELMRQLGRLASDTPRRPRMLSLNDLVRDAASGLRAEVQLDLSGQDPIVELDLWAAQEAIGALLRFMAETGSVSTIRIATRIVGTAVALTLEDDGQTPTDRELRALFTPFTKADRRPSPGVSLTRLAQLASRLGGHVSAVGREPRGLRVVLTLPTASQGSASGDGPGVTLSEEGP